MLACSLSLLKGKNFTQPLFFFPFVLVQGTSSLNQWRNGYSPICKPQIRSQPSVQLLQGRKKRHLSETALGRLK